LQNNIQIRQAGAQSEISQRQFRQARNNRLPSLNASVLISRYFAIFSLLAMKNRGLFCKDAKKYVSLQKIF